MNPQQELFASSLATFAAIGALVSFLTVLFTWGEVAKRALNVGIASAILSLTAVGYIFVMTALS